jgi:two-component system LytT family response regulator
MARVSDNIMTVSALVADDEPIARRKLRRYLTPVPWIELVGETCDGPSTIDAAIRLKPQLLFLDIRMPGLSGLEVLEQLQSAPTVVFTTAHDRFAVSAFELHALDYLLKPFGRKRFHLTLERVKQKFEVRANVTDSRSSAAAVVQETTLEWLFVRDRGKITPIAVETIERIEGRDDFAMIRTGERNFLASVRLRDLEQQLPADQFIRIHRSHIVNLSFVSAFASHPSGRLLVKMLDGTQLFASRAKSVLLRNRAV